MSRWQGGLANLARIPRAESVLWEEVGGLLKAGLQEPWEHRVWGSPFGDSGPCSG